MFNSAGLIQKRISKLNTQSYHIDMLILAFGLLYVIAEMCLFR